MAKGYKRKKQQIKKPELYIPPHLRKPQPRFDSVNVLQVLELDPEKKYIVSFGEDFEKAVIQNLPPIPQDQFKNGIDSPEAKAILKQVVQSAVEKATEGLINRLNDFWNDPEVPYMLIHLGGNDFIRVQSSNVEDQKKIFEKKEEEND